MRRQEGSSAPIPERYSEILGDRETMSIYLRTYSGVRTHFAIRRSEWFLALILIGWGYIVARPDVSTQTLRAFNDIFEFARPSVWGYVAITVGFLRVFSLIINGTFRDTPFFKYAPYGRMIAAYLSTFFWLQMVISLVKLPEWTSGLAPYTGLLIADMVNIYLTAGDTRSVKARDAGAS